MNAALAAFPPQILLISLSLIANTRTNRCLGKIHPRSRPLDSQSVSVFPVIISSIQGTVLSCCIALAVFCHMEEKHRKKCI